MGIIEEILERQERLEANQKKLEQDNALLWELVPGEKKHKDAYEYLEISDQSLRRERDRPGTLIRYRMEGTTPIYTVASLIEYRKSKHLPALRMATEANAA